MTKDELKKLKSIVSDLDASAAKVHAAGSRAHLDRAISRLGDHIMRLRTLTTSTCVLVVRGFRPGMIGISMPIFRQASTNSKYF